MLRKTWIKYTEAYSKSCKLFTEGNNLIGRGKEILADGYRFCLGGDKFYSTQSKLTYEGRILIAEGEKLIAESCKIRAEAKIAFIDVVISQLGNVEIDWLYHDDRALIDNIVYTLNLSDAWNERGCEEKIIEIEEKSIN